MSIVLSGRVAGERHALMYRKWRDMQQFTTNLLEKHQNFHKCLNLVENETDRDFFY